ncbi:MAG: DUF1552 domain-containing protein [Myxococcales bacterium]|nr:DUF1552 domain-containing protein [Myxococcales bacterium]
MSKIKRRGFLRITGGVAVASSLGGIGRAKAADAPKRLLVIFTPDGTIHDAWRPKGSSTDFTLPTILNPFESLRDDLVVLDGVRRITKGPGDGHQQGMTQMLTGRPNAGDARSTGPSVDEYVHQHISEGRPALRLGVRSQKYRSDWTRMTFSSNGDAIDPEISPYTARKNIFGGFDPGSDGPSPEEMRAKAIRDGALGFATQRLEAMKAKLGAADQGRLAGHADAISALQQEPVGGMETASCSIDRVNAWKSGLDPAASDNYADILQMQMELMVDAFACDRTRVGVLQLSQSNSKVIHKWAIGSDSDSNDGHHGLSHRESGNSESECVKKLTKIYTWHAEKIAAMATEMKTRGLLDNTVILWMSEMGDGYRHTAHDIPMVILGGAGHFQTGRYHDFRKQTVNGDPGVSHADVLTSVVNAMGINDSKFGASATCFGPLKNVT